MAAMCGVFAFSLFSLVFTTLAESTVERQQLGDDSTSFVYIRPDTRWPKETAEEVHFTTATLSGSTTTSKHRQSVIRQDAGNEQEEPRKEGVSSLQRRSIDDPQDGVGVMIQVMDMVRTMSEDLKFLSDDFKQHKRFTHEAFRKVESLQENSRKQLTSELTAKLTAIEDSVKLSREELGKRFDKIEERLEDNRKQLTTHSAQMLNSVEASVTKRLEGTETALKQVFSVAEGSFLLANDTTKRLQKMEEVILKKIDGLNRALAGNITVFTNSTEQVIVNEMHGLASSIAKLSSALENGKNVTNALGFHLAEIRSDTTDALQLLNKSSVFTVEGLQTIKEAIREETEHLKHHFPLPPLPSNDSNEVILSRIQELESSLTELSAKVDTERSTTDMVLEKLNDNPESFLFHITNMTERMKEWKDDWIGIMTQPFTVNGCKAQIRVDVKRFEIGLHVQIGSEFGSLQSDSCLRRYNRTSIGYIIHHPFDPARDMVKITEQGEVRENLRYVAFSTGSTGIDFNDYINSDTMVMEVTIPPGKVPIPEQINDGDFKIKG